MLQKGDYKVISLKKYNEYYSKLKQLYNKINDTDKFNYCIRSNKKNKTITLYISKNKKELTKEVMGVEINKGKEICKINIKNKKFLDDLLEEHKIQ